jgi:5-methylcytosine-specific restriction endonuclease McrA
MLDTHGIIKGLRLITGASIDAAGALPYYIHGPIYRLVMSLSNLHSTVDWAILCAQSEATMKYNRVQCSCRICGKEIWVRKSHFEKGEGKTCSRECAAKWKSQTRVGFGRKRIIKHCEICSKAIEVKVSHASVEGRYCSMECRGVGYHTRMAGSGNPNWKHGKGKTHQRGYGSQFNSRRRLLKMNAQGKHSTEQWEQLKAQYDYTCLCCGQKEPEIKLTYDHIVPLVRGGSDDISNAQPLCYSCNRKKHIQIVDYRGSHVVSFRQLDLFSSGDNYE